MFRTLLCLALMGSHALAGDIMMVERRYFENTDPQDSRYFQHGQRQRVESRNFVGGLTQASFVYGPRSAVIYQCDLHRTIFLNLDSRRYFVMKESSLSARATLPIVSPQPGPEPPRPTVRRLSVRNVEETKERKLFHGREAWLVRETEDNTTTVGSDVYKNTSIMETWYIDLDAPRGCFPPVRGGHNEAFLLAAGDYPGELKVMGSARRGYPIAMKQTFKTPNATTSGFRTEVIEFSEQPQDPTLFEIPADFTETQRWEDVAPPLPPRLRWWESAILWFNRLIH